MNNNYCVIMAGGSGSRFWPISRNAKPKQFLDILCVGRTLLQQTFDRFRKIFPLENIYIVTNSLYKELTIEQLPEINKEQILLEPYRKNTAPCVAYANYKIFLKNPQANIVVSPSDHLIQNEDEFLKVIEQSLEFTSKNDALLTLGIKPSFPQTGYGYIQVSSEYHTENNPNLKKVKTFTEKPDYDMAKVFFESGEFFWNSGIFIWSLNSIMSAFERNLTDVDSIFKEGLEFYNSNKEEEFVNQAYKDCINISIDYGIMEKADNVYVICSNFGWTDLGTWGSLYENSLKNDKGNSIVGENVITYKTHNCIVRFPKDKLVVIEGLEDYIIVESDDVLLICKKDDEQRIKNFVNDVKIQKGDKYI